MYLYYILVSISYKKKQWRPPSKKEKKGGKNLSPRNRKAWHSTYIIIYPRARFAKDVSLLTIWPKDHHMPGLGED
jgi:hypothetical protein